MRKVLVKNFDSNHFIILSCDDKRIVNIGALWRPLVPCPKTKEGWVAEAVAVIAEDHNAVIKFNLVSIVTFDASIPNDTKLRSFQNSHSHVGVKDSSILSTYTSRREIEIGCVIMDKLNKSMFLFINTDGGGDVNHWFDRSQASCLWLAKSSIFKKSHEQR